MDEGIDEIKVIEIINLKYKLVYMCPESVPKYVDALFKPLYRQKKLDRIVIDEVHCVFSWGKSFRREYLGLGLFHDLFPDVPILGLTATATD